MSKPLKPCPFCGSEHIEIMTSAEIRVVETPGNLFSFAACCNFLNGGCGATSPYESTRKRARKRWNKRQDPHSWVEHQGKHCPVLAETLINVLRKDGTCNNDPIAARLFDWGGDTTYAVAAWRFA